MVAAPAQEGGQGVKAFSRLNLPAHCLESLEVQEHLGFWLPFLAGSRQTT